MASALIALRLRVRTRERVVEVADAPVAVASAWAEDKLPNASAAYLNTPYYRPNVSAGLCSKSHRERRCYSFSRGSYDNRDVTLSRDPLASDIPPIVGAFHG